MYYCINLTLVNFSRFLDEIGATQLASVSGRFASFKYECDSRSSRQTTSVFHINHSFSWQSIDLFLGLFSGFGRSLNWEVDNLVEFVHICHYFMIYERYVSDIFRATFPTFGNYSIVHNFSDRICNGRVSWSANPNTSTIWLFNSLC